MMMRMMITIEKIKQEIERTITWINEKKHSIITEENTG